MKCPYCGHEELKVTDSRNANETNAIRRRENALAAIGDLRRLRQWITLFK